MPGVLHSLASPSNPVSQQIAVLKIDTTTLDPLDGCSHCSGSQLTGDSMAPWQSPGTISLSMPSGEESNLASDVSSIASSAVISADHSVK
jgi:hypothetical protein